MQQPSRIVTSTQQGIHPDLPVVLDKHLATEYRRPIMDYSRRAYDDGIKAWGARSPLILDAGCGVGESTIALAHAYPDHFVIGVDQSEDRLSRDKSMIAPSRPDNLMWLRADLVDIWRLLANDGVRLARHYCLYPNPWPKPHHLMRRWHGHPVFPVWRALGGVFEARTNWAIYADELVFSLKRLGCANVEVTPYSPVECMTPFERKYLNGGQVLYRVAAAGWGGEAVL